MTSLTISDEPTLAAPSLWRRWARKLRRTGRAIGFWFTNLRYNEPRKFMMLCIGSVLVVGLFSFGAYSSFAEDRAADEVMAHPRMTLLDFKKAVDADQVAQVKRDVVRTGGAFAGLQYRTFLEVIPKTGPTHVVEQLGGASDEVWKELTQSAFKHPVTFEEGHNALRVVPAGAWLSGGITLLVLMGVFIGAQMLMGEMISGYNFRPDRPDGQLNFDDIVLDPLVKREILEFIAQIDGAQDKTSGQHVPRGLLLDGPPGVGKTMLARAMANVMKAEFFTCTGADFVEMYVGVGPKRVRALFRQARRAASAVIFIDEIDALGSRDQAHMDSERMATLNRLLAEMDGINGQGNFLVVGATNHAGRLDAALKRPGRFDRKITIPLPDTQARADILAKYLAKLPVADDIDYQALARRTRGYAGADLRQIVEEAHKLASRERTAQGPARITQAHLLRGQEDALMGVGERRAKGEEARRVAVHELGHALVGQLRCPKHHVEKVTIIGRGSSLGYTMSPPAHEDVLETQEELQGHLAMMLGGRAAEQVILGAVSSGAVDDLARANQLARRMVGELGMGPTFGLRTVDPQRQNEWPALAEADVSTLLKTAYQEAQTLVGAHEHWVRHRTELLLAQETLEHDALFPTDWHQLPSEA